MAMEGWPLVWVVGYWPGRGGYRYGQWVNGQGGVAIVEGGELMAREGLPMVWAVGKWPGRGAIGVGGG